MSRLLVLISCLLLAAPAALRADEMHDRFVQVNGIKMHYVEQGKGPLVVLIHGFPESWYSWRHQIPAIAAAGFHVVAPDMRGYGKTDIPPEIASYSILHVVGDVTGLVDALGEKQALIVGHDFGATIAWNAALMRPDMFRAIAAMSVPYRIRGPVPPLRALRAQGLNTYYWLYYQDPGVADAEYDRDPRRTLRMTFYSLSGDAPHTDRNVRMLEPGKGALDSLTDPDHLPSWLTEADLDYMTADMARTGFRGGLNYYRNLERNWELTAAWNGAKVQQPALFIDGAEDHILRGPTGKKYLEDLKINVPHLQRLLLIPGAGHFIQQERPEQVNAALIEFLKANR